MIPLGFFARLGMGLADWSQKWFPDAFVFALVGLLIVFVAGLLAGVGVRDLVKYFGDGFWGLIPFTMQMAMIIIGGFVVATSPPVHKLIKTLAKIPKTPRGAVAFVVFFSMMTSLLELGPGPDFRRHPGSRNREKCARHRLPRDWSRGLVCRKRQRVGAGTVFVRRAGDGHAGIDSRRTPENQRRDSAEPDDLYLAKRCDRGDSDRSPRSLSAICPRRLTPRRMRSLSA